MIDFKMHGENMKLMNVNSMPIGLQLVTSSRDVENESRILSIISHVK